MAFATKILPRADHVGSLLRPNLVKQARFYGQKGEDLRDAEDESIRRLVKLQEGLGLPVATDGEARRSFWHYDFMEGLHGIEFRSGAHLDFKGAAPPPIEPWILDAIGFPADHPHLEHFRFLAKTVSKAVPKISIPGPSVSHYRVSKQHIEHKPYQDDPEALFEAITQTYRAAVAAFYEAGCRYLQLDDIYFAYLGDPVQREKWSSQGIDPDKLILRYAKMLEDSIKDRPQDLTIGMHMCRGNFRSTHIASGSYDAAADAIFNHTSVDVYFMEYDTERAGGLEPLKYLPKGDKRVMAGFITTKTPALESLDDLKRKFDAASQFAPLAQLGIAPQCGFASTEHGNAVTEDDQKRKLARVVETAHAIWGEV